MTKEQTHNKYPKTVHLDSNIFLLRKLSASKTIIKFKHWYIVYIIYPSKKGRFKGEKPLYT